MNPSTALARAVVSALVRHGVREVVLCPGSRSAPMARALHDADAAGVLRLHVRHDERVAGFTALGLSMGSAGGPAGARTIGPAPAAVVTTSGTAVANLHPAVLEASEAGVPLLVLSADRPHGLRGTWANQTTALQAGLFGAAVRASLDLPVPRAGEPLVRAEATWSAGTADLVAAATGRRGDRPGPVHGDLAFADPLVPDAPWTHLPARGGRRAVGGGPGPALGGRRAAGWVLAAVGAAPARTVVVAGDASALVGAAAREPAAATGWPLLAEPSSGARSGPDAVPAYRLLLAEPSLGGAVERVVALGRPTLSRPVSALLADDDVELVHVLTHPDEPGPAREHRRLVLPAELLPAELLPAELLPAELAPTTGAREWGALWRRAGAAAQHAVDAVLDAGAADGRLTGPLVAREVAAAVRTGELLVAAASNAVRDLDLAAPPRTDPAPAPRTIANRGLSGIDGTVSTATGAALAAGVPAILLVGDLALLHDANGLLLPPGEPEPDLRVVVLDDDGGGIFTGLEHGDPAHPDRAAAFERVFATPHGRDLVALATSLGVAARRVDGVEALRSALAAPVRGREVLVVPADRAELRALHARIRAAVSAAVAPTA